MGIDGGEFGLILGASFALLTHGLHLATAIVLHLPPSHIAMHATLLATWLVLDWATIYVSKARTWTLRGAP